MDEILRLSHISKTFPGVRALQDISFDLKRGEVHCLCGENGAGKSTLIKILSGAIQPDEDGQIFVDGAAVTITMSFDVPRHRHAPIEIYGEKGSLLVPDPNFFGGTIEFASASMDWKIMPTQHAYADDNYRIIGVADMAQAIRDDRPHRASGALAYHVLEVMLAFQTSSDAGAAVTIQSRPERPAILPTPSVVGPLD